MERTIVDSSHIKSIGHDGESTLEVEFHGSKCLRRKGGKCDCEGNYYQYYPVSTAEHAHFLRAPSLGSHFHTHIREKQTTKG